jgi:hypothetical protein
VDGDASAPVPCEPASMKDTPAAWQACAMLSASAKVRAIGLSQRICFHWHSIEGKIRL